MQQKIAVITGANRGLGLGTAETLAGRGYKVLMLGRNLSQLSNEAKAINSSGGLAETFEVDVTKPESIEKFTKTIVDKYSAIDCLVNNAGAFIESSDMKPEHQSSVLTVDPKIVMQTMDINTIGALRLCQALVPFLKRAEHASIVNVSSGMGQLSDMGGLYPAYRMSKTALNALTRILAAELANTKIKVNAVCPGWVKTDMGGPNATRSLEEGVSGIVWAATLPASGPTGGYYRDGKSIAW